MDDDELERSAVVANCAMNRERGLLSYGRELAIDVPSCIGSSWLDVCCGSAKAIGEALDVVGPDVRLVGVDLVDHFAVVAAPPRLTLVVASLREWQPDRAFDLITCVHGLHYVGDKLGALARIASWLAPGGQFVANFDAAGVRDADGAPLGRRLTAALRDQGFDYDTRRRLLRCAGPRSPAFPWTYLRADPAAGANYTGQPAVASLYC